MLQFDTIVTTLHDTLQNNNPIDKIIGDAKSQWPDKESISKNGWVLLLLLFYYYFYF